MPPPISSIQFYDQLAKRLNDPKEAGYSADDQTGKYGPPGYYVSIEGGETHYGPTQTVGGSEIKKHAFATTHLSSIRGHTRNYLGGWMTPAGDAYLDRSVRHNSVRKALTRAVANRQLAIYDSRQGQAIDNEIETDPTVPESLKKSMANQAKANLANPKKVSPPPTSIDVRTWQGGH